MDVETAGCSVLPTSTEHSTDCTRQERLKAMKSRRLSVVSCDGDVQFSGRRVAINGTSYDYVDSHEALLGFGSYGAVFRGTDRRLNRKPSVHNNTAVRCPTEEDKPTTGSENVENGDENGTATERPSPPREVAVKKVARTSLKPNELRAMKRVRHPNLVRLIDICSADDGTSEENEDPDNSGTFTYLIMELCDTDLDRHLRKHTTAGRLPIAELRRVVECISCGYLALYEKRIVHRDIKPQNILLNYCRAPVDSPNAIATIANAKITDFGISRIYEAIEDDDFCDYDPMSNVAGTFYYMAPEVGANLLRLSEYDYSADVWSIGCVVYQCLTGRIPFDESSMCKLFLYCAGANYDAYDLPELPTDASPIGEQVNALVTHLLQIDREKRATPQQLYAYVTTWQAAGNDGAQQQMQANISFASLSSVLSSSSTLENSNSSFTTTMMSSEDEEMFTQKP